MRSVIRVKNPLPWTATLGVLIGTTAVTNAQQSFNSPEDAATALVEAARSGKPSAIVVVLGRKGEDIVSSGDETADAATLQRFVPAYDSKHQLTMSGDRATLILGQDDFPFPIPLERQGGSCKFNTAAGRQEIIYRRIGENELDAVEACLAYVDAQNEYAEKDRTGAGAGIYAQYLASSPGKKDGLYWPAAEGEDQSPLGELVAQAASQGYALGSTRAPFHGYYFKVLTRQGPSAPGGSLEYIVRRKMIGGFALAAYPAEYGNSGVMTFIVSHAGTVYEKDLGQRTEQIAGHMNSFDPDRTWTKVDVPKIPPG